MIEKEENQSKLVYLFELDSVRKTDKEIEIGQKALAHEIVDNGNTVVLTYNQLVDSRAFFSLLTNNAKDNSTGAESDNAGKKYSRSNYQKNLLHLFKNGAIRVSQYEDIRTVSQYIQRTVEDDKKFIYSALPLKYQQKRLTSLVERSLRYSDLTEINRYVNGERSKDDCHLLFAEKINQEEVLSTKTYEEEIQILANLQNFLSTILRISAMSEIYIPPRDPDEYQDLHLSDLLGIVLDFKVNDKSYSQYYAEAVNVINGLNCYRGKNNNRSVYLKEIRENSKACQGKIEIFQLAEAIVDIVTNYAYEISICNISKHYDYDGLKSRNNLSSFQNDFEKRLEEIWDTEVDNRERFLLEDTNDFVPYKYNTNEMPDFEQVARITGYETEGRRFWQKSGPKYPEYETDVDNQTKCFRTKIKRCINQKIFVAMFWFFLVVKGNYCIDHIKSIIDNYIIIPNFVFQLVLNPLWLVFIDWGTDKLSKCFPSLISLSESIRLIFELCKDRKRLSCPSSDGYVNMDQKNINSSENVNQTREIDCVLPLSLRKYINLYKNKNHGDTAGLFAEESQYPIADVTNANVQKALLSDSEMNNRQYGVVYESEYHQMMVDPIVTNEKASSGDAEKTAYYSYERVVPTVKKDGIVALTRYHGKYVLLIQERHAIRKKQYAFPRGFAEKTDLSAKETVVRELKEELNAVIQNEPIYLGRVVPDSGLTSSAAAVYYTELESYERKYGCEGIENVREFTDEELKNLISNGRIDDGFTLAALNLYLSHM